MVDVADEESQKSKLDINIWGPHAWTFLHAITFTYPMHPSQSEKMHYFNFFKEIEHVLPCSICSKHFGEKMKFVTNYENEIFNNNLSLAKWLVNVHNDVNIRNGKQVVPFNNVAEDYRPPQTYPANRFKALPTAKALPILIIVVLFCFMTIAFYSRSRCKYA